jgi:spermidine/putrescine-binding protein
MKKFLLALGLMGLLGASQAMAETTYLEGKVVEIENWEGTNQYFVADTDDTACIIRLMADPGMSSDVQKAVLAQMLTAYASGKTVKVWMWGDKNCGNSEAIWFPGFRVSQ